jgi:hypothetical protein
MMIGGMYSEIEQYALWRRKMLFSTPQMMLPMWHIGCRHQPGLTHPLAHNRSTTEYVVGTTHPFHTPFVLGPWALLDAI